MKDLMVKTGTYINGQGEEKGEWVKIGALGESANGLYVLLDPAVNLAGLLMKQAIHNPEKAGKSVMVSIFDRENKAAAPPQQAPHSPQQYQAPPPPQQYQAPHPNDYQRK